MSGLLNAVLSAGGGSAVEMLGGRFGLPPAATRSALEALLPMVGGGLKSQAQAGGLEGLLGSVLKPGHTEYAENADVLARPGTTNMGNEILGAIFNNDRDVSRTVAAQAAQKTGLDVGILKQMLPVVAMMAAGAMAKNANAGGLGNLIGAAMGGGAQSGGGMLGNVLGAAMGGGGQQAGGALGGLANMLDLDKDGNPLDDIMGMLGKR